MMHFLRNLAAKKIVRLILGNQIVRKGDFRRIAIAYLAATCMSLCVLFASLYGAYFLAKWEMPWTDFRIRIPITIERAALVDEAYVNYGISNGRTFFAEVNIQKIPSIDWAPVLARRAVLSGHELLRPEQIEMVEQHVQRHIAATPINMPLDQHFWKTRINWLVIFFVVAIIIIFPVTIYCLLQLASTVLIIVNFHRLGLPVCVHCGYPLDSHMVTCPECGKASTDNRSS